MKLFTDKAKALEIFNAARAIYDIEADAAHYKYHQDLDAARAKLNAAHATACRIASE